MYSYVNNQPTQSSDPLGLCAYFYGGSNLSGGNYGHVGGGVDVYGNDGKKIGILQADYVSAERTMFGQGQVEFEFLPVGSAAYANFLAKPELIKISGSPVSDMTLKNWFTASVGRGFGQSLDKAIAAGLHYAWLEKYSSKQPAARGFSAYNFLRNNCASYSMAAAGIYMSTAVSPPNAAMVTPQQAMDAIRNVAESRKLSAGGGCP